MPVNKHSNPVANIKPAPAPANHVGKKIKRGLKRVLPWKQSPNQVVLAFGVVAVGTCNGVLAVRILGYAFQSVLEEHLTVPADLLIETAHAGTAKTRTASVVLHFRETAWRSLDLVCAADKRQITGQPAVAHALPPSSCRASRRLSRSIGMGFTCSLTTATRFCGVLLRAS